MRAATTSAVMSTRSDVRPVGSPMKPVAPPASAIGRWPASWKRRRASSGTRLPTWSESAVGSKPQYSVSGPAARSPASAWRSVVCASRPRHSRSASDVGDGGHGREVGGRGDERAVTPSILPYGGAGRPGGTATRWGRRRARTATASAPRPPPRPPAGRGRPGPPGRPAAPGAAATRRRAGPARRAPRSRRAPASAGPDPGTGRDRRAPGRLARATSSPSTTSPARSSTADAVPSGPATTLRHQCMP